jgi:adenine-specific DNA-methyltransferase
MAKQFQKLELTWIGKEDEPKLEPRILIEDPLISFGDSTSENMLIHGDNLLALKALEQDFTEKVRCIYIDPPYNTGSAFEHYDDGIEHSIWLSLMKHRLIILRRLLRQNGIIWISIDDNECHYLKVLCDEIFGRNNFLANFIWKKSYGGGAKSRWFVGLHEHILVYAKNIETLPDMFLPPDPIAAEKYYKYKDDKFTTRGPYRLQPLATTSMDDRPNLRYPIVIDNKEIWPEKQWQWSRERVEKSIEEDSIVVSTKNGKTTVSYKQYLKDETGQERMRKPYSIIDGFYTQHGTYESMALFGLENKFSFPKPEGLIQQIIEASTQPGELVLDSFLGSGTTAAVAHKMNRKWIGIELGEHAYTHCAPRLRKVISGKDKGGITKIIDWKGGGGFKFYLLAPSLLKKDKYGDEIINPEYKPDMLAAAMAKQEGFKYIPDQEVYWKQGKSSERDYIFTTTQFITIEMLDKLEDEMQEGESLLICCKSFAKECFRRHPNITIKKIPQMLLGRCEFGKDDYSFNIVNLPRDEKESESESFEISGLEETDDKKQKTQSGNNKSGDSQPTLF